MDTDRNLLFGVLALQADLLDQAQFGEACAAWAARKSGSLGDLLQERGWLSERDRQDIERLLERKLKRFQGDALASLAEVAGDDARRALAALEDSSFVTALSHLPPPGTPSIEPVGHVLLSTISPAGESRDRYTLTTLHAKGGIGQVWKARDPRIGREIALKELRSDAPQSLLASRFLKEAQVTGQLEHPGIVPVYELAHGDDGRPFYTMRFVQGRTLVEACSQFHQRKREGRASTLELRELLGVFVKVCDAIAYAHSRGVLHRDLKGQNIVLGDYGEVIVLDWGLAKILDETDQHPDAEETPTLLATDAVREQATLTGQILGTPSYMAPEQAAGKIDELDFRTDVYGLGAVLYEILTGAPPFTGKDKLEVLRHVREQPPRHPCEMQRDLPQPLAAIALRALAKQPTDRYANVRELSDEVQRFLADEPVAAYPDPWLARWGRVARRHRTAFLATGIVLAIAVVALTISTVLIGLAQQKTSKALLAERTAQRQRVEAEVEALLRAEPASLSAVLANLRRSAADAKEVLREAQTPSLSPRQARRVRLALLDDHLESLPAVLDDLLVAEVAELPAFAESLAPHSAQIAQPLWKIVKATDGPRGQRLRAAAMLAACEAQHTEWEGVAAQLVSDLTAETALDTRDWIAVLKPIGRQLAAPLQQAVTASAQAEARDTAQLFLVEFGSGQASELAELLTTAESRAYTAIMEKMRSQPEAAKQALHAVLARQPANPVLMLKGDFTSVPAEVRQKLEATSGFITTDIAVAEALPLADFASLAEALRTSGFRPVRCRPYQAGERLLTAAIFQRDGQDWRFAQGDREQITTQDQAERKRGLVPVDAAGFAVGQRVEHVVIWASQQADVRQVRLQLELDWDPLALRVKDEKLLKELPKLMEQNFMIGSQHAYARSLEQPSLDVILTRPREYRQTLDRYFRSQREFERLLNPTFVLTDISLTAIPPSPVKLARFGSLIDHTRSQFKFMDVDRMSLSEGLQLLETDATAAIPKLSSFIDSVQRTPFVQLEVFPFRYGARALAHCQAQDFDKARADLALMRKSVVTYTDARQEMQSLLRSMGNLSANFQDQNWDTDAFWCIYFDALVTAHLEPQQALAQLEEKLSHERLEPALYALAARACAAAAGVVADPTKPNDQKGLAESFIQAARQFVTRSMEYGWYQPAELYFHPDFAAIRQTEPFQSLLKNECTLAFSCSFETPREAARSAEYHGMAGDAHLARCREFASLGYRPVGISVLARAGSVVAASAWRHRLPAEVELDRLARQQAMAVVALLELGDRGQLWQSLRAAPDSRLRSYVGEELLRRQADLPALMEHREEADVSALRALLVVLAEATEISDSQRERVTAQAATLYHEHADPGVHAAAQRLLEQWKRPELLVREEIAKGARLRWERNKHGHVMATIATEPVRFRMGSPGHEDLRMPAELLHEVEIPRGFALAMHETTLEQFLRMQPDLQVVQRITPDPQGPVLGLSWYDAARYCRWLSEQEGIPEDQMCFPRISAIVPGMQLPKNCLQRTGYRLPTQAEWEFACRAGTTSPRYYGNDPELLAKYAWFVERAQTRVWPVGQLRPNDFGLFDMLGNVTEYCLDVQDIPSPPRPGTARRDELEVNSKFNFAIVRGGSFDSAAYSLRSAAKVNVAAETRNATAGFRLARTIAVHVK